jgi:hypothetical protein
MREKSGIVRKLAYLGCCFAILLVGFWYWIQSNSVFSTTSSPDHTYLVKLKGEKGRALLRSNEVRVDVLKRGTPFLSDVYLHSAGDAFDLSFEAGFPDIRWLGDSVVEFYRKQYFDKGSDALILENQTASYIKWLRVQSENKVLLFDLPPRSAVSFEIPATRTDTQWIGIEGAFLDGKGIPFNSKSFDRHSSQRKHFTYQVSITDSGFTIQSQGSG